MLNRVNTFASMLRHKLSSSRRSVYTLGWAVLLVLALTVIMPSANVLRADAGLVSGAMTATYNAVSGQLAVSGGYSWSNCTGSNTSRIVGFALFVNGATPLATTAGALDGTGMHLANGGAPCTTTTGTWSDSSHNATTNSVLAAAPTSVCVVVYDVRSGVATGSHSQIGSGTDRNHDNSYQLNHNTYPSINCVAPTVTNQPTTLIVKTHVINDNGATKQASDFTMNVTGVSISQSSFLGSESGVSLTLGAGSYSVDETLLSGYTKALGANCSGTIAAGQTKTCTVTNDDTEDLIVVDQFSGSATCSASTWTVTAHDPDGKDLIFTFNWGDSTSNTVISKSGTTVGEHLTASASHNYNNPGNYTINLTVYDGHNHAEDAHASLPVGIDACPATLIVKKHVINDNGGTLQASNFTINITGKNVSQSTFAGSEDGTTVTLDGCSYAVDEIELPGYSKSLSGDCDGKVAPGETKTCTITNNDIAPQLTVTKVVVNDNGGTKQVSDFPLFVGQTQVTSRQQHSFNAGTYVVSETSDDAYTASYSGDCDAQGNITLAVGGVKSCMITNNDNPVPPPQPAHLTIVEHVVNDNGGSAQAPDFTMSAAGTNVSQSSFPGSEAGVTITLEAGSYSVTGNQLSGYSKILSADCTGVVDAGGSRTCTVTDDDIPAQLTVTKVVLNDNGGTKQVSDFPLFVGQTQVTSRQQHSFNAGTYVVSETGESGYAAVLSGDCASDGSVNLHLGETKSCTITNDDIVPQLTVTKVVINDNGGTAQVADYTLRVGTTVVISDATNAFDAGTYNLTESGPSGYLASFSGDCNAEASITLGIGQEKSCTITNNDIVPPPPEKGQLTVITVVINDDGGTKQPSDFTTNASGTNPSQPTFPGSAGGTTITLDPGSYTADEVADAAYTKTLSEGCAGTIAAGESKTCTITNNDKPAASTAATLIVKKIVVNDNEGTKQSADFTLNVIGSSPSPSSFPGSEVGTSVTLTAGSYEVIEANTMGYAASFSADCSGTLASGETKTCTITNNDQVVVRGGGGGGGGGGGTVCVSSNTPNAASVSVVVADGASVTSTDVTLNLTFGTTAVAVALSNYADLHEQVYVPATQGGTYAWHLLPGAGSKTVYARFYGEGNSCSVDANTTVTLNQGTAQVLGVQCINLNIERDQSKADVATATRYRGQIVLQCQETSSAWYVDPATGERFYLPLGSDTYAVLKQFAVGITNVNLSRIPIGLTTVPLPAGVVPSSSAPTDSAYASQQAGRLFLEVESHGELWYVNPSDGKRYFVPANDNASEVALSLGDCITNADARKLAVGTQVKDVGLSTVSSCYPPTPKVLGASTLPRTGLPADPLVALPLLAIFAIGALEVGKEWVRV